MADGTQTQHPPLRSGGSSATAEATPEGSGSGESLTPRATGNRSTTPTSVGFQQYIGTGWAERTEVDPPLREAARRADARRQRLSRLFPGRPLVIPAGRPKQRSNDTDHPFRAHSAFAWLTGWGSDSEPGAVLVLTPEGDGHTTALYFRERASRDSDEFYANPEIGEFWIGPRPSLEQTSRELGVPTRHLAGLLDDLGALAPESPLIVQDADPELTRALDAMRDPGQCDDVELGRTLSEARLVKDDWEVDELRAAVAATASGFEDVLRALPRISSHPRGERLIEGIFLTRARADGNAVGYDTIAASGPHACILHWTRNDGPVAPGDLVLIDAGVERDSYYTADITRTVPVSGRFSDVQRRVYDAVLEAADAAFAVVRPGIRFRDVHAAAMTVIARRVAEWGILPVSAEESLLPENQHHRRYMVHGTSHHLGMDVHDCAAARRELYLDGTLEPGMVFTIEPGLYFQPDDLTVPEEYRGIGVRIEDDVLVTEDGVENLSVGIPRTADEVEKWVGRLAYP